MKLKAEGINRIYFRDGKGKNTFLAVKTTDFEPEEGSFIHIIGRSGSGKTTFINMLAGLLTPSEGKVYLDGEDLYGLPDEKRAELRNRALGIIPQWHTGLVSLTVLENVLAPVAMYKEPSGYIEKARELLRLTGMSELENVYSNELSGGEFRRMSISRALINDPEVIIADEPTGDLDDETTDMVLRLLKSRAEKGATVIMVTHETAALKYADKVYKMENGILKNLLAI